MAAKVKALQEWCKVKCDGYRDVSITNMTKSWKSGLAFCAIIHRYRPDIIDYDSLSKENVFENNQMAFSVAQEQLGIPALLDAEDMVAMAVPDKLCIVTYVSQYYNYFRNKPQEGGPGVKGKTAKKRSRPPPTLSPPPDNKKPNLSDSPKTSTTPTDPIPAKRSTLGDTCHICGQKVYIMERHIEGSKLFHRRCLREQQRSNRSSLEVMRSLEANHMPGKGSSAPSSDSIKQAPQLSKLHGTPQPYKGALQSNEQSASNTSKTPGDSSLLKMLYNTPSTYGNNSASAHSPVLSGTSKMDTSYSAVSNGTHPALSSPTLRQKELSPRNSPKPIGNPRKSTESTESVIGARAKVFEQNMASSAGYGPTAAKFQPAAQPSGIPSMRLSGGVEKIYTDPKRPQSFQPVLSTSKPPSHVNKIAQYPNRDHVKPVSTASDAQGSVLSSLLTSLAGVRSKQEGTKPEMVSSTGPGTRQMTTSIKKTEESDSGISKPAWSKPRDSDDHRYKPQSPSDSSPRTERARGRVEERISPGPSWVTASSKNLTESKPLTPRQPRATSPRSILKHPSPDDHKLTNRNVPNKHVKLHSPRGDAEDDLKPILKPEGLSQRSRSTSPPKSILKHMESSSSDQNPETYQPRGILKSRDSLETEMDTEESTEAKPKPILKSSRSLSADGVEGLLKGERQDSSPVRSILKHSRDLDSEESQHTHSEGESPPKSILKNSHENLSGGIDSDFVKDKPRPILKHGSLDSDDILRYSSPGEDKPKTAFKCSPGFSKVSSRSAELISGSSAGYSPAKSILKKKSPEFYPTTAHSNPQLSKSAWQVPLPKAGQSTGLPQVSSSFSATKPQINSAGQSVSNNFSAFNLNDSISMGADKKGGDNLNPKSAWQIEMEARQGIRPKEPKASDLGTQLAKQMEEARARKALSAPNLNNSDLEKKPDWQIEAERRKKERNGKYDDPEFRKPETGNGTNKSNEHLLKGENDEPKSKVKSEVNLTSGQHYWSPQPKQSTSVHNLDQSTRPKTYKSVVDNYKQAAVHKGSPPPARGAVDPRWIWNDSRPVSTGSIAHPKSPSPTKTAPFGYTPNGASSKKASYRTSAPVAPSHTKTSPHGMPSYGGLNMASIISKQLGRGKGPAPQPPTSSPPPQAAPPPTPPRDRGDKTANLSRSPAFRIPDSSPESSPVMGDKVGKEARSNSVSSASSEPDSPRSPRSDDNKPGFRPIQNNGTSGVNKLSNGHENDPESIKGIGERNVDFSEDPNKKKIVPDMSFSFRSGDFDLNTLDGVKHAASRDDPQLLPTPPPRYNRMKNRPLPSPPDASLATPKRRVNAEARLATNQIIQQLEHLDQELRQMEDAGRVLEEKIRSESDEAMDEDELMIQWFELINRKNELVRKESEYMYKQRAQELEDLHEELEYEFRCSMEKQDSEKTASDKIREEALLQEILETVTLRNHIVDSMEEDRLRYIAEDREIASVMALKGLSRDVGKKKKKNKNKNKKGKGKWIEKSSEDQKNDEEKDKKKDRKFFKIGIGSGGK